MGSWLWNDMQRPTAQSKKIQKLMHIYLRNARLGAMHENLTFVESSLNSLRTFGLGVNSTN